MGNPAARALLDTAGHIGPIISGSPNVLIGGAPAARKGDPFICTDPTHGGSGIIVGGSKTVMINGVSAARMGDSTDCAGVPSLPQVVSGGAPDEIYNATFASDTNDDGTIKTSRPENVKAKAFYAEAAKKDKTGDGSYDYVSVESEIFDMTIDGTYTTENGYDVIGGEYSMEFAKVDAGAGAYGSNGNYGGEANASAALAKSNVKLSLGDSKVMKVDGAAYGELMSAEAEAHANMYTGDDESRYGFDFGAKAEAQVAKGEIEGKQSNPFFEASAKIGGTVGSLGAGGGALAYIDTDDHLLRVAISGRIALALGIKADIDLTLKWGWAVDIYDSIFGEDIPPVVTLSGVVISGSPTILIGG